MRNKNTSRTSAALPALLLALLLALPLALSLATGWQTSFAQATPVEKELLLVVDDREAWPDCQISYLLTNRLLEHNYLMVSDSRIAEQLKESPAGILPRAELIEIGRRGGWRFIVWCAIDKEELIRENHFSIPLFARQRRVKAQLQGRYYVIDAEQGRIIRSGKFDSECHGPSSLQLVDFGDADPELLVSYQDQAKLFAELETRAAEQIEKDLLEIAKLR